MVLEMWKDHNSQEYYLFGSAKMAYEMLSRMRPIVGELMVKRLVDKNTFIVITQ